MGLTVKHNKANHTHENLQFRRVASALKILFDEQNWNGILIGNPYNDNYSKFRADDILLYDSGLIIIDFKDYAGTLRIPIEKSEIANNQWYIESYADKQRIQIKAGNSFINPYFQLSSYRNAFKEIIECESNLSSLLNKNQACILNIFSEPFKLINEVPRHLPFYKIIQESEFGNFLYDYSSDNKYSQELAEKLSKLFKAEDWQENISMPQQPESRQEVQKIEIATDVKECIDDFLSDAEKQILVLTSIQTEKRDEWVKYLKENAFNYNIPQIESWAHSTRICKKLDTRVGIANNFDSIYNTIYGGNSNLAESETSDETENNDEQIQEIVPIKSDDLIEESALIIIHEAHLVTSSMHQSELLKFGSGRLLVDLINFLQLDKTKRKIVFIGDTFSLSYGNEKESAVSIECLKELYSKDIVTYEDSIENINPEDSKFKLQKMLATGIKNKIFNNLNYDWQQNKLEVISKNEVKTQLKIWFSKPLNSEPMNTILRYKNEHVKEINIWIKEKCLKNGKNLSPNDLLILSNNITVPDETGFDGAIRLFNGMYLLVLEVGERLIEPTKFKAIDLIFQKLKVKCLSFENKPIVELWILNNHFDVDINSHKAKDEQIALRIFSNKICKKKYDEANFEDSIEFINMSNDSNYIELKSELSRLEQELQAEMRVKTKYDKTISEIKKIDKDYKKLFKNRIYKQVIRENPLLNYALVRYGWCLTVHKAIGSSFDNVIIHGIQDENRGIRNEEYFRWLYSAVAHTTNILKIREPQEISPTKELVFEDLTLNISENSLKNPLLLFCVEPNSNQLLPNELNDNAKGCINQIDKLIISLEYEIHNIKIQNDYLTKVDFQHKQDSEKYVVISIYNKGDNDKYAISSIRIDKCHTDEKEKIDLLIQSLYNPVLRIKNVPRLNLQMILERVFI